MGNNITSSIYDKYSAAAKMYPGNMVCFRYITVNTLNEGD
jgi:hypothetical protein